jgi:hypothetical protein
MMAKFLLCLELSLNNCLKMLVKNPILYPESLSEMI